VGFDEEAAPQAVEAVCSDARPAALPLDARPVDEAPATAPEGLRNRLFGRRVEAPDVSVEDGRIRIGEADLACRRLVGARGDL